MVTYARLTEAKRKKIVRLHKQGRSITGIAAELTCSRETTRRWAREGQEQRSNFKDAARSGRPRKLATPERSQIKRAARSDRTVASITTSVNKNRGSPVSTSTVRRVVQSGPHPLTWSPVKPSKKLRGPNIHLRAAFCEKNLRAQTHNWVFLDSKFLYIYQSKSGYLHFAWQDAANPPQRRWRSNPIVLHFYAAVTFNHKSALYFTKPTPALGSKEPKAEETFKSEHFIEVMESLAVEISSWFPKGSRWVLIRDHASQHLSGRSKAALASLGVRVKEDFPAQCWDINIIENVWGMMDHQLLGRRAKTPDGWRRVCQEAFAAVAQSSINALVEQVKARMQAIKDKHGAWLKKAKKGYV